MADETPGGRGTDVVQAGEVRSSRLESLRALAALGVVVGHVFGYAHAFAPAQVEATFGQRLIFGGGYGVFLFFALSGYLIYWPFARRDFGDGSAIALRRYARNRALRILPLYWISVIVVFAVSGASLTLWSHYLTFSENYFATNIQEGNDPLWSVVVEIQFYVLLPLIALGIARLARGSRPRAAAGVGALGLASLVVWYLTVYRGTAPLWRFNFPATFFFFTGGMLVALVRTAWEAQRPEWLRGPLGSSNVWLLASVPFWLVAIWHSRYVPIVAVPSALMVGACVLPLRVGVLTRALDWRPLALLGVASYSLYVWHVPILNALTTPSFQPVSWVPSGFLGLAVVAIPLCIAVAFVSYRFIETPFLRLRRRWSDASARTADPPGDPAAADPT